VITAKAFAGKKYAVYGLARSGLATAAALIASRAEVTAWDAKQEARDQLRPWMERESSLVGGAAPEHSPGSTPYHDASHQGSPPGSGGHLRIENLDEADLSKFDSLVVTPGLPLNRHPIAERARDAGVEIVGDIELFARARPELPSHKVIGITGTNGKSTSTALVHHILKGAGVPTTMGGNIGLPILAQDPLPESGVYVLELSSYQIDLTQSLDCDVAVLLNVTPDHLDRYDAFEAYRQSKMRLFEMQSLDHIAIFTGEDQFGYDAYQRRWERAHDTTVLVTASGTSDHRLNSGLDEWTHQSRWPALPGPHNLQNALCAAAACWAIGDIGFESLRRGLETYPGLPHRLERIRERQGVLFVNDSKATNPTATAPALAAFDKIRWICGGQPKTDNLDECAPHFDHVRSAYVIGEAAELFEQLLKPHIPVKNCGKLDVAVREAAADAEADDTVLLSPACASFDQFRDFEDRGRQFRRLVEGL
jgi:UDP-N-acetylmuramoylalanine--D-glutamate ligase